MSHSACKLVIASVIGQEINDVNDIRRIGNLVRAKSLDLLQADHTLLGIDIALWDLLGRRLNEPVRKLLGYKSRFPKTPYASVLFVNDAAETLQKAKSIDAPGLGIEPDFKGSAPYLVDVEIRVRGKQIYATPELR